MYSQFYFTEREVNISFDDHKLSVACHATIVTPYYITTGSSGLNTSGFKCCPLQVETLR